MDDVIYEEFKGTGNMELVLNRDMSEKRVFPAIDIYKSGTRRDDLILTEAEYDVAGKLRHLFSEMKTEEATERTIQMFDKTKNNKELIALIGPKN
jgi:transcription termination factor Rho